jgi:hypothetical protein
MKNTGSDQEAFLFVTHVYSEDFIKEFKKIQNATRGLGSSYILYHAKDNEKVNQKILDLPHYICTESGISGIGYPTYSPNNSLVPGSSHFLLIKFYRENLYKNYWFIEYDVRFTGKWKDLFDHFNNSEADLITSHIRRYEEQVNWPFWTSISHPMEKIETSKLVRSFNPIYRISLPALKYIDEKYQQQWRGHNEVSFATLLYNAGFKLRDFGGKDSFTDQKDINRFYTDGSMLFRPAHMWLFNKPRNKLFHPVKPEEKKKYLKKEIKKLILPFFLFNEEVFQVFKNSLLKFFRIS